MTERVETPDRTEEGCSHSAGTGWGRFFRVRQPTAMDAFEHTVDEPRGGTTREWELFCRETTADPLRHVGSVSAPSAAVAREQATRLFGHVADTFWLCPADETVRVQRESVGVTDREGTDDATMDEDAMRAETLRGED